MAKEENNESISARIAITDNAIKGLENLKKFLDNPTNDFGNIIIDTNYADIVSYIISDVNFWHTLINEASTQIYYNTNKEAELKFEDSYNFINDVPNPTRIECNEIVEKKISKALINAFNKYIEIKSN